TTHTYWENQKRIIKNTYWYLMKSTSDLNFIPQKEEGITEVKWIKKDQVSELLKNSYASVADVFRYSKS
ncbi:MAG: NUDIX hydrolase, partial [Chlamydiota bacterium]